MQTTKRNLRNIRAPKNQKGLTLIELAIGLTIVLAVTALIIGVSITTTRSQRTNDVQTQLTSITAAVRGLAPGGNYTGIDTATLVNSKKLPEAWLVKTDPDAETADIKNPFGGQYNVEAADVNGGTGNGFTVSVEDVPVAACADIISNSQANYAEITIGTKAAKTFGGAALSGADIANDCNAQATNDLVTVEFTAV